MKRHEKLALASQGRESLPPAGAKLDIPLSEYLISSSKKQPRQKLENDEQDQAEHSDLPTFGNTMNLDGILDSSIN